MEIYEELVKVYEHPDTNLDMDTSLNHFQKTEALFKLLQPLVYTATNLQSKHISITKARKLLNHIEHQVVPVLERDYNFFLDTTKISPKFEINPRIYDKDYEVFEDAAIKLQKKKAADMSDRELFVSQKFIKDGYKLVGSRIVRTSTDIVSDSDSDSEQVKDLRALMLESDEEDANAYYYDMSFVCASTAEVERLWSMCALILTHNRTRMTKDLFEALIYLRYNDNLWGKADVALAIKVASDETLEDDLKEGFELIDLEEIDESESDFLMVDLEHANFFWDYELIETEEEEGNDDDDKDDDFGVV